MKSTISIFFLLIVTSSFGQNLSKPVALEIVPQSISTSISGDIVQLLGIDLDGDSQQDFIAIVKTDDQFKHDHYWFSSDFKLWLKKTWYTMGIQHTWFVNLDEDPELEVFYATGYEDGIDYYFADIDLNSGKENILFYFNPILIENNEMHWGYPWDINDIRLSMKDSVKIYVSLDHDIDRTMGVFTLPENQTLFPVVFFTGHPTQPYDRSDKIRNPIWQSIERVGEAVHNNR